MWFVTRLASYPSRDRKRAERIERLETETELMIIASQFSHVQPASKRILMIAAAFPPTGGPGVQRTAKFAKHLPQFGWQPVVWTIDRLEEYPSDVSLANELSVQVKVHRQPSRLVTHWAQRLAKTLRDRSPTSRAAKAIGWRLERWTQRHVFPDKYAAWTRKSVVPLCRLTRECHVDAIYSTFSPASNHWLALKIKRITGLPWIADFRDLWMDDYRYGGSSDRLQRAHRRLEQEVLEVADAVVGVTTSQTELLASHVTNASHKFHTITNGFDPIDFDPLPSIERTRGKRFVLAYVGRLDTLRAPPALIEGIRRFIQCDASWAHRFVFRVIGHVGDDTASRIQATGVDFEFEPYKNHREAVRAMHAADALLVTVPDGRNAASTIPAKSFEYLATSRPILHVGPTNGECARLIQACDAGMATSFDSAEVMEALSCLFDSWLSGSPIPGCNPARLAAFERAELTRRLAHLLDEVTRHRGPILKQASRPKEGRRSTRCVMPSDEPSQPTYTTEAIV